MKRLLSILFTLILLFSLFGYQLVIGFLQAQQQDAFAMQINQEAFAPSELRSLKVPATLPYYTNSKDFQYVSGEVHIDGTVYRYVKRRIYNDSIEYLCLKDNDRAQLLNAREQFYQLAYDLQANKEKAGSRHTLVKPLMLEYCAHAQIQLPALFILKENKATTRYKKQYGAAFIAVPAEPPEQTAFV